MNIFGLTITRSRRGPSRAERNALAASAGAIAGAIAGDSGPVAVRIHRDELALVERLVRAVDCQLMDSSWPRLADDFVASLHLRLGAASAVEANPQFVPFLPDEIAIVERAVKYAYRLLDYHRLELNGRQLLEDLRLRLGHAEAVRQLGSIAVFANNPFPISPLNP